MYTIEIDCAPMTPRPDTHLPTVLNGTPLTESHFQDEVTKVFGNWTWTLKPEHKDLYEEHRTTIEANVKELYHDGKIRYGSW